MRSFANLDYLYLEITKENSMKLLFADKSTQCDEYKYVPIIQENGPIAMQPSISRQPPERPPPPKLRYTNEEPIAKAPRKKSGIDTIFREMKIKKRFNTLRENTKKLTKSVHTKMHRRIEKSQSVFEVRKPPAAESENNFDGSSKILNSEVFIGSVLFSKNHFEEKIIFKVDL